jgi:hypothetical protein
MSSALTWAVPRLEADVIRTLGERYREIVAAAAANLASFGSDDAAKLVHDVQQELHDTFVDTTWPACARHGRHPLWYHEDGWWWCEAEGIALYRLGELPES